MRSLLLITTTTFLFFACNSPSKESDNKQKSPETISQSLSKDSLRILYFQFSEALKDPLPTNQIQEKNKIYPVDEAPLDTQFYVFREQLKEAVNKKDIFFLMERIDDNIVLNEQTKGINAFAQEWSLTSEAATINSPLWPFLDQMLQLGGVFDQLKIKFHLPYYSATYPSGSLTQQSGVIKGAGVRMRASPGLNSKILKNLSYDLIDILEITPEKTTISDETFPWVKIKTKEGLEGFVWGKFTQRPQEQEIIFRKVEGRWKIVKLKE